MLRSIIFIGICIFSIPVFAQQVTWENVSDHYAPLPTGVQVYKTNSPIEGKPNIAYYVIADLKNKELVFDTDTSRNRRLTPQQFYDKNGQPLVVVNTTFFSFTTNQNLNAVIMDGKLVSYNVHSLPGRAKDTLTYRHPLGSAIGITKKRTADVAWLFTDSSKSKAWAFQEPVKFVKDSLSHFTIKKNPDFKHLPARKWKMQSAVGGGPVLLQNGQVTITNNQELKFAGKAIDDKHPRTAMGYTANQKLVIMVVQGRSPGIAEGASLKHLATLMQGVGCVEALNLDGGGSSTMIVNGKLTITPSDKEGQRAVPAVFMIRKK